MFTQNFKFLTLFLLLFIPVHFMYTPPLPPQHTFTLVSYPTTYGKKFQDAYEFLNEKLGSKKRENNIFKTQHKRSQCFLHRYIYGNKNIYIFIKKF